MFSSTLALFTRSFRVDARSTRAHVLRLLFVCAILLELVWIHEMEVMFGAPGLTVFMWISWLNFVVISLAGIGYFATAISEEKEDDSLGLLKMAGISPVALLLGKSTTRLVAVLLMLAVEFPFVLLSITLGGVTMTQVFAMAAALAAYLVLVANLGLFSSVLCSTSRRASTLTTLTLFLLLVVLPIAAEFASFWTTARRSDTLVSFLAIFIRWEHALSMWQRISAIGSTGFAERAVSAQVIFHLAAALGFFAMSWAGFERFTRERHAVRPLERLFARSPRRAKRRRAGRPWPAWALTWKDFYFVAGGTRMVIARFVIYFGIIIGLFWLVTADSPKSRGLWAGIYLDSKLLGGTTMVAMIAAAAIELGLVASRIYHEEVKAHTLPLLMMLPQSTARTAWLKAAAAVPVLIPTCCYFLLGALMNVDDFKWGFHNIFSDVFGWYVLVWYIFFLHLAAYLSLVVKWGAMPLAIFLVYFLQMLLFPMFTVIGWYLFGAAPSNERPMMFSLMAIGVAATAYLEFQIPRRLRQLAGR